MHPHLHPTRSLRAAGLKKRDIAAAVRAGRLTPVRRGWYATPAAHPDVVAAARIGGRLTCLDALRRHGAWVAPFDERHVRISSGTALRPTAGARLHWVSERLEPGLDSIEDALRTAVHCADLRALVTAIDSLAHRRLLDLVHLRAILESSPRGRRAWELHDPRSESGIETLVRLALRRRRIRTRTQVMIEEVGRVDFLIGERLVLEADGFEWHSSRAAFERDRDRDRELVRRGYVVIRLSYARVMGDLDSAMLAVVDVVRRRDHRWRSVHRARLSGSGYLIDLSSMNGRISES